MNYYDVLGVNRHSSQHQIKRAYRQLAFRYHPDRNPDNLQRTTQMFRQIQEAYDHLKDEKRRIIYDSNYMSYGSKDESEDSKVQYDPNIDFDSSGYSEGTKFEAKDGVFAITLVFIGHVSLSTFQGLDNSDRVWGLVFLVGALCSSFAVKALAKLLHSKIDENLQEGLKEILIYNCLAIVWLIYCSSLIKGTVLQELLVQPVAPSLLAALAAGLLGAAFGRAFAASGSSIVGMAGGGITAAIVSGFLGVWVIFAHIASTAGQKQIGIDSQQAFLALILGSIIASALGSITMRDLFIYNLIDGFEAWFDRFRPRPKTKDLNII